MMFGSARRPLIIGHRGARGLYPENTLAGFSKAIALGVDAVELDVAVTADSVVVVTHDPGLNPDIVRNRDGNWLDPPTPLIRELTFEQLSEYEVGRLRPGSAYARAFPDQRPEDGVRVPTLAEVVAFTGHVPLLIEMKTFPTDPELAVAPAQMAELVVEVLNAAGAAARSMVLSFDWRGLRHLRRCHPEILTGWLTQEMDDAERRLWRGDEPSSRRGLSAAAIIAEEGGQCWLPEWGELRPREVEVAQQLGLWVVLWNLERPNEIERAIEWGVDALITDRPDLAKAVALAKGQHAPDIA